MLGGGSVGFGLWALIAPRSFAETMGISPSYSRLLSARDLGIGATILAGHRVGYALRAVADVADAVTVAGQRPRVSAGAAGFAAWAALAGLAGRRSDDAPAQKQLTLADGPPSMW